MMTEAVRLRFSRPPRISTYMPCAFVPKRKHARADQAPAISAICEHWLPTAVAPWFFNDQLHPIHLHATTVRMMMTILTHPLFPVPIWHILQIRNRITVHALCRPVEKLVVEARWCESRVTAKGVEYDLRVAVSHGGRPVLSSLNVFYSRGRHGRPPDGSSLPAAPVAPERLHSRWSVPRNGAGRYCRTTGDYNAVHYLNPYARALGFRSALAHPHRVLADIVDRVFGSDVPELKSVDVWFKGPVYYRQPLLLSVDAEATGPIFALRLQDDPRPAVIGKATRQGREVGGDP